MGNPFHLGLLRETVLYRNRRAVLSGEVDRAMEDGCVVGFIGEEDDTLTQPEDSATRVCDV